MKKFAIAGVLFFSFSSFTIPSEQLKVYDVKVAGMNIGSVHATKFSSSGKTVIITNSNCSIWLGRSITVVHETKYVFDNEKLIDLISTTESSKGNFHSTIKWMGTSYKVDINSYKYQKTGEVKRKITTTVGSLFFNEPKGLNEVFAEGYGEFVPITKNSDGTFVINIPDKKRYFSYQSGKLVEAEIENPVKNFVLELKQ